MADRAHIEEVEEQAALFAVGALPPDEARRFQQRLAAGCPLCGAAHRECEEAVALLALSAPEAAPPPALRARLLAQVRGPRPEGGSAFGAGLIVRAGDTAWEAAPAPGIEYRRLLEQKTVLVRMPPKTTYPAHVHRNAEQCLVLEGSVTADGVTAYAGDFTYMPKGSRHQPLYSEEGCLLLIAYT